MSKSASLKRCKKLMSEGGVFTAKLAEKAAETVKRLRERLKWWEKVEEYIERTGRKDGS